MPTYDYLCESNGRVIEVSHRIGETLETWGALCARAGMEPGDTPAGAPVRRLIGGAAVLSSTSLRSVERPCDYGTPCGGCDFNPD